LLACIAEAPERLKAPLKLLNDYGTPEAPERLRAHQAGCWQATSSSPCDLDTHNPPSSRHRSHVLLEQHLSDSTVAPSRQEEDEEEEEEEEEKEEADRKVASSRQGPVEQATTGGSSKSLTWNTKLIVEVSLDSPILLRRSSVPGAGGWQTGQTSSGSHKAAPGPKECDPLRCPKTAGILRRVTSVPNDGDPRAVRRHYDRLDRLLDMQIRVTEMARPLEADIR